MDMLPQRKGPAPLLPLSRNRSQDLSTESHTQVQTQNVEAIEVESKGLPIHEVEALERREMQVNEGTVPEMQAIAQPSAQALPIIEMPAAEMMAWEMAAAGQNQSAISNRRSQ